MAVIDGATATTDPRGACYHLVFRWLDRSALYVPIVQRPRTWPFQGQNTGSNPVGDATLLDKVRRPNLSVTRHGSPNQIGSLSRF
jgi:hypothetical protein